MCTFHKNPSCKHSKGVLIMIRITTELGNITLTSEYFANLVGEAASSCYGVKGMAVSDPVQGLRSLVFGSEFPDRGVRVSESGGKLLIELHINMVYGVNISAISDSIINKVTYAVEQASGFKVAEVNVFVDKLVEG